MFPAGQTTERSRLRDTALMGAQPDLRLTWSFLHALAEMWSSHPGTYKVVDEAEDLVPALAQMCIRAFASEVRESVTKAELDRRIVGELTKRSGERAEVSLRDVANKMTHGSPERIVVANDGDVRLYFVNSTNESPHAGWIELWFSARDLIDALHVVLSVKPHDSASRDHLVRSFIEGLGSSRFLPTRVED